MRTIHPSKATAVTRLAFAQIPLSGFALDIFIPSFPTIATDLHTTPARVQLMLSIFLVSLGIVQLFIGSILDSFGRFIPTVVSLALFSLTSFVIAATDSLALIYGVRALQGAAIATIVVSKRATLMDLHAGETLKKHMSLLSVVWSAAPIIAPFLGGFLQVHIGWRSNFSLLGFLGLVFLLIELIISGETIREKHPFNVKSINEAYTTMIKAKDFSVGLLILGFSYAMVMVYNMASPFLVEQVLNLSPTVTGNMSLVSGIAILLGGLLSRQLISQPLVGKIRTGLVVLLIIAGAVTVLSVMHPGLATLVAYVIPLHLIVGFIFNAVFSYVLTRFPQFGGKAGGLAGGTYIIMTAVLSQGVVGTFELKTQVALGLNYISFTIIILLLFIAVKWVTGSHSSPVT